MSSFSDTWLSAICWKEEKKIQIPSRKLVNDDKN